MSLLVAILGCSKRMQYCTEGCHWLNPEGRRGGVTCRLLRTISYQQQQQLWPAAPALQAEPLLSFLTAEPQPVPARGLQCRAVNLCSCQADCSLPGTKQKSRLELFILEPYAALRYLTIHSLCLRFFSVFQGVSKSLTRRYPLEVNSKKAVFLPGDLSRVRRT